MRTHFCNPEPYRKEWGRRRHQAGIGLLGAILLALAIAVAAIALSAYHAPRKEDDGGLKRSIAVMGAATIIDALRADRSAALDGAFNLAPEATVDARRSGSAEALAAWRDQLVQLLGEGASGGVACNGPTCIVTVRWIDRQAQEQVVQHLETEVRL